MVRQERVSFDEDYRRHLRSGRFMVQQCTKGHSVFPPRPACVRCGDRGLEWVSCSGVGTIYSLTTISPRDAAEYAIVIVDLDDGFRMMSRMDGESARQGKIGDRVRATIRPVADGDESVPCFDVVQGSESSDAR